RHPVRLIEVRFGRTWHRYLTSVLDPNLLPAWVVADLYRRRWRIEEAFLIVKRLLNLSYLWTGSLNGILLQVWATWLFFAATDPVKYFAAPENQDLGIVKRLRKKSNQTAAQPLTSLAGA
ncbi:MAG: transposase, partial [Anaerolineae bacterium]|nr:transposase [Anaerolineae bacterium]